MAVRTKRLQSALEFMMTYGWIILVIITVLASLYALGVFNIASSVPNTCNLSSISCITASLSPSGTLSVNLQQATQDPINVISVGCNDQGVANEMIQVNPPISIPTGGNATFTTECYKTTSGTMKPFNGSTGQSFKGYLVVNYTDLRTGFTQTSTGTLTQKVVSSIASGPLSFGALEYLPITLTNTNTLVATGTNFQDKIIVPASSYSAYEASDLGNVRFSIGSIELNSWCEAGCSSGSGSTSFWVNLGSTSISASNSIVVDMLFLAPSTEYDGAYAGECPTCSASYAQYDNGGAVFSNYYNFAGSTCPSAATTWDTVTCSNGITIGNNGNGEALYSLSSTPGVVEFYGNVVTTSSSGMAVLILTSKSGLSVNGNPQLGVEAGTGPAAYATGWEDPAAYCSDYGYIVFPTLPTSGYHIFSMLSLNSNLFEQYNYNSGSQISTTCSYGSVINMGFLSQTSGDVGAYWLRTRAYPPGDTMPSTSFGSIVYG